MFHVYLCYAVLYVICSLVVTFLERADFLALFCVVFSCVVVTFPFGVPGQVWYLIVLIPDLILSLYFYMLLNMITLKKTLYKVRRFSF